MAADSDSSPKKGFWDILLIQDDGKWFAFRSPWANLQNLATYFSVILIVAVISTFGWFFSRWKVEKLEEQLIESRLAIRSLKDQSKQNGDSSHLAHSTLDRSIYEELPLTLNSYNGPTVEDHQLTAAYNSDDEKLKVGVSLKFSQKYESLDLKWVLILTGVNGIYVYPDVLTSKEKDLINVRDAKLVSVNEKASLQFNEEVSIPGYMRKISSEPYWAHSLFYDQAGNLIAKTQNQFSYGTE